MGLLRDIAPSGTTNLGMLAYQGLRADQMSRAVA